MSHNINNDEDDYKDDYNDIDYYDGDILLDNKMIKEEGGGYYRFTLGQLEILLTLGVYDSVSHSTTLLVYAFKLP